MKLSGLAAPGVISREPSPSLWSTMIVTIFSSDSVRPRASLPAPPPMSMPVKSFRSSVSFAPDASVRLPLCHARLA
jgi:hypothetical protein